MIIKTDIQAPKSIAIDKELTAASAVTAPLELILLIEHPHMVEIGLVFVPLKELTFGQEI
jgi:hypothetical protein